MSSFDQIIRQLQTNTISIIDGERWNKRHWVTFCENLKLNKSLKRLNLCECQINDSMITNLSSALCINSSIEYLNLCDNLISDIGMEYLQKDIIHNNTLKELLLKDNLITKLDSFSEILRKTRIQTLTLPYFLPEVTKVLIHIKKSKWYEIIITLCSIRSISRIGSFSAFNLIPIELIRKLSGLIQFV
jgi:hypothetical protein